MNWLKLLPFRIILLIVISSNYYVNSGAISSQIKKLSAQIPLRLEPAINAYKALLTGESGLRNPAKESEWLQAAQQSSPTLGSGLLTSGLRGGKSIKFAETLTSGSLSANGLQEAASAIATNGLSASSGLRPIKIPSAASLLTKSLAPLFAFPKGLKAAIPIWNSPIGLKIKNAIPIKPQAGASASESSYSPIFAMPHYTQSSLYQSKPTYNTMSYGGVPTVMNPFYPSSGSISNFAPFLGEIPSSGSSSIDSGSEFSSSPSGLGQHQEITEDIGSHLSPSNPEVSYLGNPFRPASGAGSEFSLVNSGEDFTLETGERFKIPKEIRLKRPKLYTIPKSAIPSSSGPQFKYVGVNENGKKLYLLDTNPNRMKPLNSGTLFGINQQKFKHLMKPGVTIASDQTASSPSPSADQGSPHESSSSSLTTSGSSGSSSYRLNGMQFPHHQHHHFQSSQSGSSSPSPSDGTLTSSLTAQQMNQLLSGSSSRPFASSSPSPGSIRYGLPAQKQQQMRSPYQMMSQIPPAFRNLFQNPNPNSHAFRNPLLTFAPESAPQAGYSSDPNQPESAGDHESNNRPPNSPNHNVQYDEKVMYVYVDENGKTVSTKVAETDEGPEGAVPDGYFVANPDAPSVPPAGTPPARLPPPSSPGVKPASSTGSSQDPNYQHNYKIQHPDPNHPFNGQGRTQTLVRGPQYQVFSGEGGGSDGEQPTVAFANAGETEGSVSSSEDDGQSGSGGVVRGSSSQTESSSSGATAAGGNQEESQPGEDAAGAPVSSVDMNPGQEHQHLRQPGSTSSSSSSHVSSNGRSPQVINTHSHSSGQDPSPAPHRHLGMPHTRVIVTPSSLPPHLRQRGHQLNQGMQFITNHDPHALNPNLIAYRPGPHNPNVIPLPRRPTVNPALIPTSSGSGSTQPSGGNPSMIVSYPTDQASRDLTHYYLVKLKKKLPASSLMGPSSSSSSSEVPSTSSSSSSNNDKLINSSPVSVTTLNSDADPSSPSHPSNVMKFDDDNEAQNGNPTASRQQVGSSNTKPKDMVYMLTDYKSYQTKPKLFAQNQPTFTSVNHDRPQVFMRVPVGQNPNMNMEYSSEEEAMRGPDPNVYQSQMLPPGFVPYDPSNPLYEPMRQYQLVPVQPQVVSRPQGPRSSNSGWIPITDSYKKQKELNATLTTPKPTPSSSSPSSSASLSLNIDHEVITEVDGKEDEKSGSSSISLLNGEDVSNTAYYSGASPSSPSSKESVMEEIKEDITPVNHGSEKKSDSVEGPVVAHHNDDDPDSDDGDDSSDHNASETENTKRSSNAATAKQMINNSGFKVAAVFDHDFKPVFTDGSSPSSSSDSTGTTESNNKSDITKPDQKPLSGSQKEEVKVTVTSSVDRRNNDNKEIIRDQKKAVFGMRLPPTTSYSMKISTFSKPSSSLAESAKSSSELLPTPEALSKESSSFEGEDDDYEELHHQSSSEIKKVSVEKTDSPLKSGNSKEIKKHNVDSDEDKETSESNISSQSVKIEGLERIRLEKPKQYLVPIPGEDGKPKAYVIFSKDSRNGDQTIIKQI